MSGIIIVVELQELSKPSSKSKSIKEDRTIIRVYLKKPKVLQLLTDILEKFVATTEVLIHAFKIFYSLFSVTKLNVSLKSGFYVGTMSTYFCYVFRRYQK